MKAHGIVTEVNTGGIARNGIHNILPSIQMLKRMKEFDIPVTIGADAHTCAMIDDQFDLAVSLLKEAGYRECVVFEEGAFIPVPLC